MRYGWAIAAAAGLALIALVAAATPAAAAPATGRRVALLVGNWDYDRNGRFDADHAAGFASDLHSPCSDAGYVGKQLERDQFAVRVLCNLTRDEWAAAIIKFATDTAILPNGSVVFVYYSGHGIQHNGFPFTVPVGFQMAIDSWAVEPEKQKVSELRERANDLSRALQSLNNNPKIALIVAIDACRDTPAGDSEAYNQQVSILVPYNAIIQYATTPGDRLPDSDTGVSDYARTLVAELARGGEIGNAMTRVYSTLWQKFYADKRNTYADMNTGPAFLALPSILVRGPALPVSVAEPAAPKPVIPTPVTPKPVPPVTAGLEPMPAKQVVRATEDGLRFDVLWCEGPGQQARFDYAMTLASAVAAQAKLFGVGRVQVKVLPAAVNPKGYNVHRNLMRFDPIDPRERNLLNRVAAAFPEGHFLPQSGVGVGGHPTWNYVSAFVCSPPEN